MIFIIQIVGRFAQLDPPTLFHSRCQTRTWSVTCAGLDISALQMRWRSTTLRAPASRPWVGSQALLDSCNARTEIYKCKCMTPKCSPSYHCKNQTWQKIVRFVFQVSLRWQVNRSQSSSSGLSSLMPSVLLSAIHGETRHWYLTKLEPKAYRDTMQVLILYILYMQICPVTILNTCFWLL